MDAHLRDLRVVYHHAALAHDIGTAAVNMGAGSASPFLRWAPARVAVGPAPTPWRDLPRAQRMNGEADPAPMFTAAVYERPRVCVTGGGSVAVGNVTARISPCVSERRWIDKHSPSYNARTPSGPQAPRGCL